MYKAIHHIVTFRFNKMKNRVLNSNIYNNIKLRFLLPIGVFDKLYINTSLEEIWKERIADVISCPDNALIVRHNSAGQVKNGKQLMHNGINVTLGGYYGDPITQMLYKNKGVHEPQEELAFGLVLDTIPEEGTMIELGSYWAFYSIWFNKKIKNAKNFMVEPDPNNLRYGVNNFRLNRISGIFTNAYVGKKSSTLNKMSSINIDDYVAEKKINFIDILHSDIQGFELDMLLGASQTIKENKIGYFFISTHGNKVHYECLDFLLLHKFQILCSADEFDTYSLDGLIVAKAPFYKGLEKINISLKSKKAVENP